LRKRGGGKGKRRGREKGGNVSKISGGWGGETEIMRIFVCFGKAAEAGVGKLSKMFNDLIQNHYGE
jgi:hypothetical protein